MKSTESNQSTSPLAALIADIPSSISVSLVSLPLCVGIAVTSGAPPVAGLLSGVLGGIVVGWFSGSRTSVTGPSAGLTAVVLASIGSFGGNYQSFLVAVVLAGLIQVAMGAARVGVIAHYFPSAVIRGFLVAVGIILIFKQIPHAMGIDSDPEGDFSFFQPDKQNTFSELVQLAAGINLPAVLISVICLAVIIIWNATRLKRIPVPSTLIAVVLGIVINTLYGRFFPGAALSGNHLIQLPSLDGEGRVLGLLMFPNWSSVLDGQVEHTIFVAIELAIVASLESLVNIEAIDSIDAKKRRSPRDQELVAQGLGNLSAGLLGGLPMTGAVVRSKINVDSGCSSKWSTILHGLLIGICFVGLPWFVNQIPLASLAAVLLVTGAKLLDVRIFKRIFSQGWNQILPFAATVIAIIFSDLLVGIAIGMAVGIFFVLKNNSGTPMRWRQEKLSAGEVIRIKFSPQVTFLNRAALLYSLESLPNGSQVVLDASESDYVDEDILELIHSFRDDEAPLRGIKMNLVGFRDSYSEADYEHDYINVLTQETQQKLTPGHVLKMLREGNQRFVEGVRTDRDFKRQVSLTRYAQHPMAVVLSCIDSRTTSELIFDLGLGDIFSVRVAGNVVNGDILGSIEYATKVAGARLIVVTGHTNCGAVKAACDDVKLGNVTPLLRKIHLAIERETTTTNDRCSQNTAFVAKVTHLNTIASIEQILENSPTIAELVQSGEVAIVGSIYDTTTGRVEFFGDLPEEPSVGSETDWPTE